MQTIYIAVIVDPTCKRIRRGYATTEMKSMIEELSAIGIEGWTEEIGSIYMDDEIIMFTELPLANQHAGLFEEERRPERVPEYA